MQSNRHFMHFSAENIYWVKFRLDMQEDKNLTTLKVTNQLTVLRRKRSVHDMNAKEN